MTLTPTILVYDRGQVQAVLAIASELHFPVCLRVPFTVAAGLGPAVARALVDGAFDARVGSAEPTATRKGASVRQEMAWELDCGDAAGLALQALRLGVPRIRIDAGALMVGKLTDIASRRNAIVVSNDAGAAGQGDGLLDLCGCAEAGAVCRRWLDGMAGKYRGKDKGAAEHPVA